MKIRIAFNGDRFIVEKRGFFCWEYVRDQAFVKIQGEEFRHGYKTMTEAIGFVSKMFGERAAKRIKTKFFTVGEYQS